MSTNQIRLDELLARQLDVQWYEGVAIVQAVCRQLLDKGVTNGEFPVATQIGIGADGTVPVLDTTPTAAVPAAAHLLAGLLSDDVPVRLRLAVSQATGLSSTIESLREFSETLAYFERPDSQLIVRNLVNRAMAAAVRKETDEPRLAHVATEQKRERAARPARDAKALLRLAAIAAAAVAVAAGGLLLSASRDSGLSEAFSGLTNVFGSGPEAAPNEPLEKAAPAKEIAATGATRPERRPSSMGTTFHGQSGEGRQESPGVRGPRAPSVVPLVASVKAPAPSRDTSNATEPAQTYVIIASEPGAPGTGPIYSKADAEVTPPRQVYPALPAEPPTASMKRALTVVDLVIAPDGLVEHVRLRTTPRDIHEFMLLSAAKAWRFQPALLDGRPVRFLHSVALTAFQ